MTREQRLEHYVKIVLLLLEDYAPQERDDALVELASRCIEERRNRKSSRYALFLNDPDAVTAVDSPAAKAVIALADVRRVREDNATTEPGDPQIDGRYHEDEVEDDDDASHAAAAEMRWKQLHDETRAATERSEKLRRKKKKPDA